MKRIDPEDIVTSLALTMQHIACYHTADFLRHLTRAFEEERSAPAKAAMRQILISSRLAALGRRPMCQDTGMITVFAKLGQGVQISGNRSLQQLVDEAIHRAWLVDSNPLRASMVADPIDARTNTRDNTPGILHVELVPGDTLEFTVAAKGGGSENKVKFGVLNPAASVADWVVKTVETLGAGWCPPGVLGIGVGGSAEKSMLIAKEAVLGKLDMTELLARGPSSREEEIRLDIYTRVNALGIGAQGLGGMTTVLDVKLATFPTHAASLPVALVPQCAANRHAHIVLDGSGVVTPEPPNLSDWPELEMEQAGDLRRVDLDTLTKDEVAGWRQGETLLLSGRMLTGRDAAHKRMQDMITKGQPLPVSLNGRAIYYVGPVDPVPGEAVGPAGPTTSTRMDPYTDTMLDQGLLVMIGKAERGPDTIASIAKHKAAYLIAVGGAAVLVARAIRDAKVLAFEDLGMEAIHEFTVQDMPVTVAVDATGASAHMAGPMLWRMP